MNNASQIRAMIVEDDVSWQQILCEILTDNGILVDVASNLEDAYQLIKARSHKLALVDLSLEGSDHNNSDGLNVLKAIKHSDPDCQSILLTGFATVELAVSVLMEYGAFSFLRKENFNRTQFRDLVRQAAAVAPKRNYSHEEISGISLPKDREESNGVPSKIGKVLIVDDDAGWRSILEEIMIDSGYDVRVCSSFGDALGVLRRETIVLAVIDLSLTDSSYLLPNESDEPREGFKLLETTKENSIPTIVVSGIASVDDIQQAYNEHSVFAYLEKQTFDRNTFRRLVSEARLSGKSNSELDRLTVREREVFDLLAKGMTNKEIAENLVITTNTVKRHIKAIFEKLEVHTRAGATSKSILN
jgi:RNA polymerase sigma factor (sigma-70 family)